MIMLRWRGQGLKAPGGERGEHSERDNTVPVGPNRSVLMVAGACPASTSREVAASTKPEGPQTKMSGAVSGGKADAAMTAALMRPGGTPRWAERV